MRKSGQVVVPFTGFVAAALALAACDITIGASEYSVREEKRFAVSGPARLSLSTFDGSIEVRGWDRNEVMVEVEKVGPDQKTVERIEVRAAQDGSAITIDVPKPSPLETTGLRRTPSANLVVAVPLKTTVRARSGDGSIHVSRISGAIDLDTEDGSIRLEEVAGTLVARTGDGSVHAQKVDGQVEIRTGDGSIGLDGVLTGVTVETRDGSVDVTARPGSRTDGEWDVTTGDGDVTLDVPESFGAEIDARTGDGRVRIESITDAPHAAKDEGEERESAAGRLAGGGKALRIRTSSGSITVKRW
jgi:nitrogen regulatory protein PII